MATSADIDFSCLLHPGIYFQEVANFIGLNLNLKDFKNILSKFIKSNSSKISFQSNAYLGFLFFSLQDEEFTNYFSIQFSVKSFLKIKIAYRVCH